MLSVVFLFEFENDGMGPSKRYSFISLLFILKCLSKTLVMFVVAVFFFRPYALGITAMTASMMSSRVTITLNDSRP